MLMIGIAGKTLAPEEHDWIRAPMVCGVILFTRNFASRSQVAASTTVTMVSSFATSPRLSPSSPRKSKVAATGNGSEMPVDSISR